MSSNSLSAGAVRFRNHAIETPKVDRWETLDHRWQQDRRVGENPETRRTAVHMAAGGAWHTAGQAIPAVEEVPDAVDSLGKEVKYAEKSEEQLP